MLVSDIYGKPFINSITTFLTMIALVCSFGNICFGVATWKVKNTLSQRNTYNLLLNFFFAEWLTSTIVLPANITFLIKDGDQIPNLACLYVSHLGWITNSASALSLSYISLCRMSQICYPKFYNRISKPVCIALICVSTWIPCALLCFVFGRDVVFRPHFLSCVIVGKAFYRCYIAVIYIPATATISFCYVRLCMYTKKCRRLVKPEEGVFGRVGSQNGDQLKTAKKVIRFYSYCVLEILIFYIIPGLISFHCGGDCDGTTHAIPEIIAYTVSKSRSLASLTLFLTINSNVRRYLMSRICSLRILPVSGSKGLSCCNRKKRRVGQEPEARHIRDFSVYVINPAIITSENAETVS